MSLPTPGRLTLTHSEVRGWPQVLAEDGLPLLGAGLRISPYSKTARANMRRVAAAWNYVLALGLTTEELERAGGAVPDAVLPLPPAGGPPSAAEAGHPPPGGTRRRKAFFPDGSLVWVTVHADAGLVTVWRKAVGKRPETAHLSGAAAVGQGLAFVNGLTKRLPEGG